MANVTLTADDRGQLILVSGLLMTVGLVALVLLVNTVIYTENLATRGVDVSGHEALSIQNTTAEAIGEFIPAENRNDFATQSGVENAVSHDIDRYEELLLRQYAVGGTDTRVENVTLHEGRLLRQTDPDRRLTNESGVEEDWTLVTNADHVRGYDIRLTNVTEDSPADAFQLRVSGSGGKQWRLYAYDSGGLTISVKNGSESVTTGVCSTAYSSTDVTIDVTAGTVNGTDCPPLRFATNVSAPYDIAYANGRAANGTYNLTVNTSAGASVETNHFNGPSSPTSPYWVYAVYSADAELYYESSAITYRMTFRVAPGEAT